MQRRPNRWTGAAVAGSLSSVIGSRLSLLAPPVLNVINGLRLTPIDSLNRLLAMCFVECGKALKTSDQFEALVFVLRDYCRGENAHQL